MKYFGCVCYHCVMGIEAYPELDDEIGFMMYEFHPQKFTLKQKLKVAWKAIFKGELYPNDIVVSREDAGKMVEVLQGMMQVIDEKKRERFLKEQQRVNPTRRQPLIIPSILSRENNE